MDENLTSPPVVSNDSVTFKRIHLYAVLIPLAFVIGLASGYLLWGRPAENAIVQASQQPQAQAQAQPPTQSTPQNVKRYDVSEDDNYSYGPSDAPITIIEFSDYQCPFCRRWYSDTWLQLREDYKGKIRLVYRDFPLFSIHSEAGPAALAANCAGEQGKYYEYHDLLFSSDAFGAAVYEQYASQLGLNMTQFKQCITDKKFEEEVNADFQYASNLGINSTPTFFINGIPLVGAQPYDVFKQVIDQELAGKIP
jgi:protein-disulfide isomerase